MALSQYTGKTTPGASVTVYWTGTTVKATIYASSASTAKSNPIVTTLGDYGFWIEDGVYDIVNGSASGDLSRVSILSYRDARVPADEISLVPYRSNTLKNVQSWVEDQTDSRWSGGYVFDKSVGNGIKVDQDAPAYCWQDLIGAVYPKTTGAGTPSFVAYQGNISAFAFVANDLVDFVFHIPHDWVPGTTMYLHVHQSHNGTSISGDAIWTHYSTYAKGFNQENFPAEVTNTLPYTTTNITTTPRYRHRVDEIPLTSSGGSATTLDHDNIEVDGLILIRLKLTTAPTVGSGNWFLHTADIHYQSSGIGTVGRAPSFYG